MSLIQAALEKADKQRKSEEAATRKLPKADLVESRPAPKTLPDKPVTLMTKAAIKAARQEATLMDLDPALKALRERRSLLSRMLTPRKLLAAAGILFLLYLLSRAFVQVPPPPGDVAPQPAISAPAAAPLPAVKPAAPVHSIVKPVEVKARPGLLPRPASKVRLALTGIMEEGEARLALINDQVVGVGQRLQEGPVVRAITENSVTVVFEGRETVLHL